MYSESQSRKAERLNLKSSRSGRAKGARTLAVGEGRGSEMMRGATAPKHDVAVGSRGRGAGADASLRSLFFFVVTVFKRGWKAPTISTGSIQDNGEKSIRSAKNSTSILRRPPSSLDKITTGPKFVSLTDFIEQFDCEYSDLDIVDRREIKHLDA